MGTVESGSATHTLSREGPRPGQHNNKGRRGPRAWDNRRTKEERTEEEGQQHQQQQEDEDEAVFHIGA